MHAREERKISTKSFPCNSDSSYDFYQCIESYFFKKRGCQYPWNVYKNLNLSVCNGYNDVQLMMGSYDRNMGYERVNFTNFERAKRTKGECLPPCRNIIFDTEVEKWNMDGSRRSLQIAFSSFNFVSRNEYIACGWSCVIGELGGNLGFFLGGSILFAIDIIMEYISKLGKLIRNKIQTNILE